MNRPLLFLSLVFFSFVSKAQQERLPADLRQHNLTTYNASLFNPAFSLDRNNPESVALWVRWQWQGIDSDPSTLFLNYTRKLDERSAAGAAFFQHNTGIFFNTGGAVNYAYKFDLNPRVKLSVGANLFGFTQKLADDRFQIDPTLPLPLDTDTSDFILQFAPGISLEVERLTLSLASENLLDYNFGAKEGNTAKKDKIFMSLLSYDFPVNLGSATNAFFRPSMYLRTIPGQSNQVGFYTLLNTNTYWGHVGYNNFYGFALGGGYTLFDRVMVGALAEFGTGASIVKESSFELMASYFLGTPEQRHKMVGHDLDENVLNPLEFIEKNQKQKKSDASEDIEKAVVKEESPSAEEQLEEENKEAEKQRKEAEKLKKQQAKQQAKEEKAVRDSIAKQEKKVATALREKEKEVSRAVKEEAELKKAAAKEAELREAEQKERGEEAAVKEAAEQEAAEEELEEKRALEKAAAEEKAAEAELGEKRALEKAAAEKKAAEAELNQKKASEKAAAEKKAAERQAAEQEAAVKEAGKQEAAKKKLEEKRALEKAAAEKKAAEEAKKQKAQKQTEAREAERAKAEEAAEQITTNQEALDKANRQKAAEEKAEAAALKAEQQRKIDSVAKARAAAIRTAKVAKETESQNQETEAIEQPQAGEKYEEVRTEAGLLPGYYLIANVFGTQKYYDAFMNDLKARGMQPKSFRRSTNGFNYVYLQRYKNIQQAREARDNQYDGKYTAATWIFRVTGK